MKSRFTAIDVTAAVNDLKVLEGARINNVYDINHKTYMMKLSSAKEKFIVLFESGIRIHRAYHDYPKSSFPSNFSVKLRKHLNNRRVHKISQISMDRIVDLQVDEGDRCFHVIIELYDRGNIVLTDSSYTILNILRPRTEKESDVKLVVKESYVLPNPRTLLPPPSVDEMMLILMECDQKLPLKRVVVSPGLYSSALVEHVLLVEGLNPDLQVSTLKDKRRWAMSVVKALKKAAVVMQEIQSRHSLGFIPYRLEKRSDGNDVEILLEFHPYLFAQHEKGLYKKFDSFSEAVDAFYAAQSAQKQQQDALKVEKEAVKKLENVKNDQLRRIDQLEDSREKNMKMADLIILNKDLVDSAVNTITKALSRKASWSQIEEMHRKAVENGDPVAKCIVKLNLENNKILMRLNDEQSNSWDVPIDINMSAFNNSRELYQGMKLAAEKIVRTKAAAGKAIKNAEAKTHDAIKQIHVSVDSAKAKKEMWFEKFIWFISSENYMVIVGRDADQNEILVKRYLRPGDIYVHADAHGAASVIIRNKKGGGPIPPKTMTEAAQMAVCFSSSWSTHIISAAWWVYDHQVSKIAPSGEYLVHGSFMIRGKKNFMPCSPLQLGFGILFRIDEVSVNNRKQKKMDAYSSSELEAVEENSIEAEEEREDNDFSEPFRSASNVDEDYPDIQLDVPTIRCDDDPAKDYSIIEFDVKGRRKKNIPTKDKETQEYLEKKVEDERKAAAAKKRKNNRKRKQERIRKRRGDEDEWESETTFAVSGNKDNVKEPSVTNVPNNVKEPSVMNGGEPINQPISNSVIEEAKKENVKEGPTDKALPPDPSIEMAKLHLKTEQTRDEARTMDDDDESKELLMAEDTEGLVSQLISKPSSEDVLLYALTMVGPYQAFSKFKYRAKIMPGTYRKNKAGKAALDLFLRVQNSDPHEKALIRALVGDENAWRNIPKGSRVFAPHLYAK